MESTQSPQSTALLEDRIRFIVSRIAQELSMVRKFIRFTHDPSIYDKIQSSEDDMVDDWYNACNLLVLKILDGTIKMTDEVGIHSFWRLQAIWFTQMKKVIAYFNWQYRVVNQFPGDPTEDYFKACDILRKEFLCNESIKDSSTTFKPIKEYLEQRYLSNSKVDQKKYDAYELIRQKAERIYQITGRSDEKKNWEHAEIYTRMFYENIIPAVMKNSFDNILPIIKAFQFSERQENGYQIINCFEAALVIYFINSESIMRAVESEPQLPFYI